MVIFILEESLDIRTMTTKKKKCWLIIVKRCNMFRSNNHHLKRMLVESNCICFVIYHFSERNHRSNMVFSSHCDGECTCTKEELKTTVNSLIQKSEFVHAFSDRVLILIIVFLSDYRSTLSQRYNIQLCY